METNELKVRKKDLLQVPVSMIKIEDGFNVRQDMGDLEGLMQSIIQQGQLEAVKGFKKGDFYILTEGHRRFQAIKMAIENGHEIPYINLQPSSGKTEDRLFEMVTTGTNKKSLNAVEEASAYKRIKAYGYTIEMIAQKVGKSVPHIYQRLQLADAPQAVKNSILDGSVSATTVMNVIRDAKGDETVISETINTAIKTAKAQGSTKITTANVSKPNPLKVIVEALNKAELTGEHSIEKMDLVANVLNLAREGKIEEIMKLLK